ncbi:hypothetical protein KY290_003354 [Solanum tuberosum]|uniref:Uncharacterized protein n=1 Tax=Solanum tuberosum TaxID=4113 RepID=A0ABQ7WSP4_SOLTU|nr:hypothetical protein KY290_003354 [Solanum tuberosum]
MGNYMFSDFINVLRVNRWAAENMARESVLSEKMRLTTYLDPERELVMFEVGYQLLYNYADQIQNWGWMYNIHSQASRSFISLFSSTFIFLPLKDISLSKCGKQRMTTNYKLKERAKGTRDGSQKKTAFSLIMKALEITMSLAKSPRPHKFAPTKTLSFLDSGIKWRDFRPEITSGTGTYNLKNQDTILNVTSGVLYFVGDLLVPNTIDKNCVEGAKVLQQVDKKFILQLIRYLMESCGVVLEGPTRTT